METVPRAEPVPVAAALRAKTSAYVGALRIPFTILLLVVAVYAAYYFLYVTSEREYLTGRNFRLLATIGEQIDAAIRNDQKVLDNLLRVERDDKVSLDDVFKAPLTAEFIPILRTAKPLFSNANLSQQDARSAAVRTTFAEHDSRFTWVQNDDSAMTTRNVVGTVRLELDDLLRPFLAGELQTSVFNAVLVAASDGRVIFHAGDPRLRITRVDKLEIDGKPPQPLDFARLARSSAMADVHVSGSGYKLLMQPCCGRMLREGVPGDGEGWVLCGLMEQRATAAASSAVPFSMMALLMALLLLALFSWPFLKLSFIGEAQRVRAQDVVLVGLGALLGIALVTVAALDLYAYWRLEAVLDDQLQRVARSVKLQANQEVAAAFEELTRLESHVLPLFEKPGKAVAIELAKHDGVFNGAHLTPYPFFDSLAVLNRKGEQQQKLAFESFATPLIEAGTREYFQYWNSPRSAPAFLQPLLSATTGTREAVLSTKATEPTKAIDPLAVTTLTIPMHSLIDPVMVPGFGFAVLSGEGRVLFHSDPHHTLSEDFFVESDGSRRLKALVSARHEEWVDIKYWGDDQRAFVTPMELSVGAEPAKPLALFGQPWTLITFYDKHLTRTVNVEWLVIIVVLVVAYASVYVVVCLGVLFLRPTYRAPWLWPDPTRSRAYLDAVPLLLILTATFAVSIVFLAPADLIVSAGLLPFLAWILTYRALSLRAGRHRWTWTGVMGAGLLVAFLAAIVGGSVPGRRGVVVALLGCAAAWTLAAVRRRRAPGSSPLALPVNVSYGLAAGLLLLLVTAMPAAAFFKIAYDTVLESFIKYGQLQIALDRSDHENRANDIIARRINDPTAADRVRELRGKFPKWWGGYDTFFFCTRLRGYQEDGIEDASACPPLGASVWDSATSSDPATVPEIVEEVLPFYSESSVWFRELVHDRAADSSWSWSRSGSILMLHLGPKQGLQLASVKPPFIDWPGRDPSFFGNAVLLALVVIAVIGAILWVARFVIHSVFVVDVIEPLWSGSADPLHDAGQPHLFIVTDEPTGDQRPRSTYCEVDLALAPSEESAENQWFGDQLDRLTQAAASQDVLIRHFDERPYDRVFNERKLTLVERAIQVLNRTVIIISAVPPGVLYTASDATRDQKDMGVSRRWTDLLSRFTIIPAKPVAPAPPESAPAAAVLTDWATAGWREIVWRLNALGFSHSASFLEDERRDPVVGRLWKDVLPYAWHPDRPALDVRQLIAEVAERAEHYYREIWATCTPAEKLVLGQVAKEGLVNEKTKRTVRVLMARGLVRRQPHFTLMNETFRQFVLSPQMKSEVDALEEQSSGAWDVMRWPFLIILIASLGFFFATQQELFKTVLGALTAAAAIVPAVVKMATSFGERRSAA